MIKGHSLLIPKGNYTTIGDMPAEQAASFFESLPRLVNAVKVSECLVVSTLFCLRALRLQLDAMA